MKAYVGQTRASELIRELEAAGVGECTTRGTLPPRRGRSWFYDNGAFEDFRAGQPFDYLQFSRDMRAIRLWQDAEGIPAGRPRGGQRLEAPDFIVIPDLVAGGAKSLEFSEEHLIDCRPTKAPLYVAVQDGMSSAQVARFVRRHKLQGLFVGGSLEWKLETGGAWCALGRELGLPVHVGRVGTFERVLWAHEIGAASIDSSLPLWAEEKLERFLEAMRLGASSSSSSLPLFAGVL